MKNSASFSRELNNLLHPSVSNNDIAPKLHDIKEGMYVNILVSEYIQKTSYANAEIWLAASSEIIWHLATKLYLPTKKYDFIGVLVELYTPHLDCDGLEIASRLTCNHNTRIATAFIHGDLKIGNVLFTDENGFKVIDWEAAMIGPVIVDPLKAALSYIRTKNKLGYDESATLIQAAKWLNRTSSAVLERLDDQENYKIQLLCSFLHLLYQEAVYGNHNPLKNNYKHLRNLVELSINLYER